MATESDNNEVRFTGADAARGAVVAVAGAVVIALAVKEGRKARVLGLRIPREFTPSGFDAKKVARRIERVAAQLEKTSDDVRLASAQARRVSERLA
jgi:hypothetical protein